jgi:hypothetical protein
VFIAVLTRMFLYACWLVVNTLIRLLIRDTQGWGNGDMGEVKTIVRLQKKLQRALDGGMNDSKTLRYLNELYTIPMTVDLLQVRVVLYVCSCLTSDCRLTRRTYNITLRCKFTWVIRVVY